ncbi:MAG: DMT family transporter [Alphaproteobacteria bacterium]|nr:DMT family transporter [Alphaproteobacteria bacterium]
MAGPSPPNNPALGIICIVLGMTAITVNDMLIKLLSDGYPLHQMVFLRSIIAVAFSLGMVQLEGGWKILRTDKPFWHLARGLLLVVSNLSFFAALVVLPLADATALFFVAPLFITLLSIPILGEKVGIRRISAVLVGFAGVLVMQRPWESGGSDKLVMLLPVLAAFTYALCQILARRLGASAKASAMAAYIQGIFIVVSIGFYVVAGDGRFAAGVENESLRFLLMPWRWPDGNDGLLFLFLGLLSAVIGYTISQAYRLAPPATVAPFEYVAMPLAVLWGWLVWDYLPSMQILGGIILIMGAGLYVFVRERKRGREQGHQ